jgi:ketosteroid isomerase-like protein
VDDVGDDGNAWTDRVEIEELLRRYSDSVTRSDWDQNLDVWAPDAVWELGPPINMKYEGASTICEFLQNVTGGMTMLVQTAHNIVVHELAPDRATATVLIRELNIIDGEPRTTSELYATYHDELVKLDGRWKIARRLLEPIYMARDTLPGDVVAKRG